MVGIELSQKPRHLQRFRNEPSFARSDAEQRPDHAKLDSFLNRCKRLGFCDNIVPTISDVFSNADDSLFKTILKNSYHRRGTAR